MRSENPPAHALKTGLITLQTDMGNSAHRIHQALQTVATLRQRRNADPSLAWASKEVKRLQAQRFQATYADLLLNPRYKRAAAFFLQELYGDKDYAERDQQFGRIANTIAKLFPEAVVDTAATLAEVHALTETLDDEMARNWILDQSTTLQSGDLTRYINCWRRQTDTTTRHRQLDAVMKLGKELDRLTQLRGLRTLLKMMRRPATIAGLSSLQQFLETGFDAFTEMRGSDEFLAIIKERESHWIEALYNDEPVTCETRLRQLLSAGTAPGDSSNINIPASPSK